MARDIDWSVRVPITLLNQRIAWFTLRRMFNYTDTLRGRRDRRLKEDSWE